MEKGQYLQRQGVDVYIFVNSEREYAPTFTYDLTTKNHFFLMLTPEPKGIERLLEDKREDSD